MNTTASLISRAHGHRKLQMEDDEVNRIEAAQLVVLSTFRSVTEAEIARGILESVAIDSTIRSDNAGGMYPALNGAELLVRADDAERAREALRDQHGP